MPTTEIQIPFPTEQLRLGETESVTIECAKMNVDDSRLARPVNYDDMPFESVKHLCIDRPLIRA